MIGQTISHYKILEKQNTGELFTPLLPLLPLLLWDRPISLAFKGLYQ
jgi:hypothetical protein